MAAYITRGRVTILVSFHGTPAGFRWYGSMVSLDVVTLSRMSRGGGGRGGSTGAETRVPGYVHNWWVFSWGGGGALAGEASWGETS